MLLTVSDAFRGNLEDLPVGTHIYIAYSGGLDSQVLLHALTSFVSAGQFALTALHLNHGLSRNADAWQAFCEKQCVALNVPILFKSVQLDADKGNLEQRAREIRYQWFSSFMAENTVLLTAHHQNDQAETVILRLMRASGVRGLAAIPSNRCLGKGRLIRPLLNLSKADLQSYARHHELRWVEDKSNENLAFDRNYVRHQILPHLSNRWPQAVKLLARSANNCRDDLELINELAAIDADSVRVNDPLSVFDLLLPFNVNKLTALSDARQRNVLQYSLSDFVDHPISQTKMIEWLAQVRSHTQANSSQLVLEYLTLAIHDNKMYFLRPIPDMSGLERGWQVNKPLDIPALACKLSATSSSVNHSADQPIIRLGVDDMVYVHWRRGGERVQFQGETFSRSFKKLLQEKRVAPWLRNALPLVSVNDQVVWSAALGDFSPKLVDSNGNLLKIKLSENKPVSD